MALVPMVRSPARPPPDLIAELVGIEPGQEHREVMQGVRDTQQG
jgi:hypothetical protein